MSATTVPTRAVLWCMGHQGTIARRHGGMARSDARREFAVFPLSLLPIGRELRVPLTGVAANFTAIPWVRSATPLRWLDRQGHRPWIWRSSSSATADCGIERSGRRTG
jgi:hypothetical protein